MGKLLHRNTKNTVPFLQMLPWGSVHFEILSADITRPSGSLWFFMGKRHLGQWLVKYVENILIKNWKLQNTLKNSTDVFLFEIKDIKISDIFYQIKKVNLKGSFPRSSTYSVKNLRSTALERGKGITIFVFM